MYACMGAQTHITYKYVQAHKQLNPKHMQGIEYEMTKKLGYIRFSSDLLLIYHLSFVNKGKKENCKMYLLTPYYKRTACFLLVINIRCTIDFDWLSNSHPWTYPSQR